MTTTTHTRLTVVSDRLIAFLLERTQETEGAARARIAQYLAEHGEHAKAALAEASWSPSYAHPTRILARCAADYQIIALHSTCRCATRWNNDIEGEFTPAPCPTLLAMARVWVDHRDYDPEWSSAEPGRY